MFFKNAIGKTKHQIKIKNKQKKEEEVQIIILTIYYMLHSHLSSSLNKIDSLLSINMATR